MDYLDMIKPKAGYPLTGSYKETPSSPSSYFEYAIVDRPSKSYGELTNNLITTKEGLIIRTMWDCGFAVDGRVITQDGKMWSIAQIQMDNNNNEALRFLQNNPTAEYIIALMKVDNPWGLR